MGCSQVATAAQRATAPSGAMYVVRHTRTTLKARLSSAGRANKRCMFLFPVWMCGGFSIGSGRTSPPAKTTSIPSTITENTAAAAVLPNANHT